MNFRANNDIKVKQGQILTKIHTNTFSINCGLLEDCCKGLHKRHNGNLMLSLSKHDLLQSTIPYLALITGLDSSVGRALD